MRNRCRPRWREAVRSVHNSGRTPGTATIWTRCTPTGRAIGDVLKSAYADGFDPAIAAAVAEFTAADIAAEISPGLRPGLPG